MLADAFKVGRYLTRRPFEPDNWWIDVHEANGKGRDVVWALRIIDDHDNNHQERKCRATKVVNQCNTQLQGVISDLLWVVDIGTENSHEEMRMTPAGILAGLCDKPGSVASKGGKNVRAAVACSVAKNEGWTTDGLTVGQWWQLVTHWPGKIPGTTTAPKGKNADCKPPEKQQLCLAGDAPFHMDKTRCHIAIEDVPAAEYDIIVTGANFRGIVAPMPPDKDLNIDPKSNHKPLKRGWDRGIRPWVKIPRPDVPTVNDRPGVPQDFPGRPTLVDEPATVDVGAFSDVHRYEATGNDIAESGTIKLPRTIKAPNGITVSVNYITPVGDFTGTVECQFDYCVIPIGGSAAPGAVTRSLSKILSAGLGSLKEGEMLFNIPHNDIKSAGGGKIAFAFYRLDRDAQLDDLDVVLKTASYGPAI
jgi:hypothetical protein